MELVVIWVADITNDSFQILFYITHRQIYPRIEKAICTSLHSEAVL